MKIAWFGIAAGMAVAVGVGACTESLETTEPVETGGGQGGVGGQGAAGGMGGTPQCGDTDGDLVTVTTEADDRPRSLANIKIVAYDIPYNCAAMYFPEANILVPANRFAHKSRTPASKFIPVTIKKD